jgi:hypothetical protein
MASMYNCFLICPKDGKLTLVASCLPCSARANTSWVGDDCYVRCRINDKVVTTKAESKNDSRGSENLVRMCKM